MPELSSALEWAAERKHGVLITIRRDGRPQSSDIAFSVEDGAFLISLTADRAKTHNMRRDPRVVLHLTEPSSWSHLSFDGAAELSEVTTDPSDDTSNRLVAYYEAVAGQAHPDWDEYRQAMIDEGRLLARLAPTSVVGQMR